MREITIGEFENGYGWAVTEDGKTIAYGWEKTQPEARKAATAALKQ